jgi:hypothetical protein
VQTPYNEFLSEAGVGAPGCVPPYVGRLDHVTERSA